jgi:hypothetical protein
MIRLSNLDQDFEVLGRTDHAPHIIDAQFTSFNSSITSIYNITKVNITPWYQSYAQKYKGPKYKSIYKLGPI